MADSNDTLKNGAIGAVITFILFFVPIIGIFSPVFGGGTSGYLQKEGVKGGAVVGIVMAVLSSLPALLLGFLGIVLGTIPLLGDSFITGLIGGLGAIGGAVVLFLWFVWTIYALMLGVIGGIIGGAIAE